MSDEENYFENYYSETDTPEAVQEQPQAEPPAESQQESNSQDLNNKITEIENQYKTLLQQQQEQKSAIAQAYGFEQKEQKPNEVDLYVENRAKSIFEKQITTPEFQSQLAKQVMTEMEANKVASELGFADFIAASNTYDGMLRTMYNTANPQVKAQIQNVYSLAQNPATRAEALKQAQNLTGFSFKSTPNTAPLGTQTFGHPPTSNQEGKTVGAYSDYETWAKDYYDGDASSRKRAEKALKQGAVPSS